MRYRNFDYEVERAGPAWKWSIKQSPSRPASSGLAASERTAIQSAKIEIDKIARQEIEQIEADLRTFSSLLACIDPHLKQIAALRQHKNAEGAFFQLSVRPAAIPPGRRDHRHDARAPADRPPRPSGKHVRITVERPQQNKN